MSKKFDNLHLNNNDMMQAERREYMNSQRWQTIRIWALSAAKYHCEKCGQPHNWETNRLHVHHKSYQNFGNERPWDVIVMCETCHAIAHGIAANDPQFDMFDDMELQTA